VIFTDEAADLIGHPEQLLPLFSIRRRREVPAPNNGIQPRLTAWTSEPPKLKPKRRFHFHDISWAEGPKE
jgi:hypothetical protein